MGNTFQNSHTTRFALVRAHQVGIARVLVSLTHQSPPLHNKERRSAARPQYSKLKLLTKTGLSAFTKMVLQHSQQKLVVRHSIWSSGIHSQKGKVPNWSCSIQIGRATFTAKKLVVLQSNCSCGIHTLPMALRARFRANCLH